MFVVPSIKRSGLEKMLGEDTTIAAPCC